MEAKERKQLARQYKAYRKLAIKAGKLNARGDINDSDLVNMLWSRVSERAFPLMLSRFKRLPDTTPQGGQ